MKKITLFLIFYSFFICSFFGQNEKIIYANKDTNVFLHFEDSIVNSYVGNENYLFLHNVGDGLGVLKILDDVVNTTNILITTKNGLMYSFILKYKNEINQFNVFVKETEAINYKRKKKSLDNEKNSLNIKSDSISSIDSTYNISDVKNVKNIYKYKKEVYFNKTCKKYIDIKPFYFKNLVSKNQLIIKLNNIHYNKNELYFIYEIKNKSSLDLNIDMITYEISSKSKKLRASAQAIIKTPIYTFQSPKVIKGNSTVKYIAVFDMFTIGRKKVFLISIKENNGERDINLSIAPKQINNPN